MTEPLSPDERDVLKLTMLGKSPEDIGIILTLPVTFVNLRLRLAVAKVNAPIDKRP